MNLSPHFSLEELVHSQTAERQNIDNTPTPEIIENLRMLAAGLEQVRDLLGKPVTVSSGYRCPALNTAVGGAIDSQHMQGQAADIISPGVGTPLEICRLIDASGIRFDQLIYEYDWCHISFSPEPRRERLTLDRGTGGYLPGIVG